MKNEKKSFGEYYLGIDAGTDSVGWAVTDGNYNVLKFHGKAMWGVRLFEEAQTAADRRAFRTARRRQGRKVQRTKLLQELFAEEICKKDSAFFIRMADSKYYAEDKTEPQQNALFNDVDYTDKDYHKEYPTVYHLRRAFIEGKDIRDPRLLYLAVHHIINNRGHFLFEGMDLSKVVDFETPFSILKEYLREEDFGFDFSNIDADALKESLKNKQGITQKKKDLYKLLGKEKGTLKSVCDLLAGGSGIKLTDLFNDESLAGETPDKISLSDSSIEDDRTALENILQDRIQLLDCLKAVYDWAILDEILSGSPYISFAKTQSYEKHKKDLALLKKTIKRLCPEKYKEVFKSPNTANNYCAYSGMCVINGKKTAIEKRTTASDFGKYIAKLLSSFDDPDAKDILRQIDAQTFMPKQRTGENSVLPYQVHKVELEKILGNAEMNFPFLLKKDDSNLTVKDKIIKLLTFRIPYYVGPLNDKHRNSGFCWIVRKNTEDTSRILPWEFEQKVDLYASAEQFINRMTNKCTYLVGEDVLPKDSLLYSEYSVLNELNNLKLNGESLAQSDKAEIIDELYKKNNKVKIKDIANYYKRKGFEVKPDDFTGFHEELKSSLRSYNMFFNILRDRFDESAVEAAIKAIVLFGNDKKMLLQKLRSIKNGYFTEEEIKRMAGFKFSDWGRLSEKMLTGIYSVNKETGEAFNIIEALRTTDKNLMQLLSAEFDFKKQIDAENEKINGGIPEFSYDALVKDCYASPAVKRSIWQVLTIAKEIEKITGHAPKKIFMETTREDREKKATKSRKKQLVELYKKCREETSELLKTLEKREDSELRNNALYLYYTQMGKCMYSGETIELEHLFDKNVYDIDHIYPQSKTKDDSLNNKVLVKKELNGQKSDRYPIPRDVLSPGIENHWKCLRAAGLISEEKYKRLTRRTNFSDTELSGFIARQLVETNQATKAAAEILKRVYPETRLVYSRASNVDVFKKRYDILKVREVNDYHHARDAYLNIVVGNVFDVKFTMNPLNFIKGGGTYSLNENMYDSDIRRGNNVAWVAGNNGTIATVKKTCSKENILFTRYAFEQKGGLFDQQIMKKGKGQLPTKPSDPHMQGQTEQEWIDKYGGYNKLSGAYFCLVEHGVKNKRKRSIEYIPIYLAKDIEINPEVLNKYLSEKLGLINPDIRIKKIKIDSLFNYNGCRINLSGRSDVRLLFKPAIQLRLPYKYYCYAKIIAKFHDKEKQLKTDQAQSFIKDFSSEVNIELYTFLTEKIQSSNYSKVYGTQSAFFISNLETFKKLSAPEQVRVLYEMLILFKCNSIKPNFELLDGTKGTPKIRISKNLNPKSSFRIVYQSATGLFEHSVDLLTV